ncbi:SUMF1/EgtB/PvdO family nonheme iron enzyme [Pseudanabaena galeata UHCC 0370]|uniref:SUMF1/EgtB/PvdO family nonheme iron enzyme n=1 Tax=Pseudanabaena galeata UHCC 0370 TaxID=3110310 RepID=A0ABU5TDB2_9CYAN|nr:SUMF1/EgtB/PvdO family nonheme iron enzyme [Pseudanabaena galeata]MEA5476112.1 SUMF1/EgtB/PvdO family nonheme iron enzyme [Pseudanabaena galeata UHCC 0370]
MDNAHSLYGNVWEWCADDWLDSYKGAQIDLQIWTKDIKNYEDDGGTKNLLRGSLWDDNRPRCRPANRNRAVTDIRGINLGF